MSGGRRGGERRQRAPSSVRTGRRHERSSHASTGRVLHSVLRPVHVDPHYAPQAQASEVRRSARHRGRVNPRKGERTGTGVSTGGRSAARRAPPLPQGRGVARRRKGRRSRSPSLRGLNEPGFGCPHVVVAAVAEVGRRRLVSNKLGKRAPKRAAGSSERGPSTGRRSAGDTVGRRVERKDRRGSGLPAQVGRAPARGPGWRESAIQRSPRRESGAVVVGPGL
jgi:hypothetical protein